MGVWKLEKGCELCPNFLRGRTERLRKTDDESLDLSLQRRGLSAGVWKCVFG